MWRGSRLVWVCLLLLSTSVRAATFVVAAGVEKYDDPGISSLKYAVADARSVAAVFRASGIARDQVTLLTSNATQAARRPTRNALLVALEQVKQRARHGDKVVFFFAGHGIEEAGHQYLLTVDTRRNLVDATALPMDLVNRALKGLQASDVVFIIDACRNAPDAGRGDEGAQLTEGLVRGIRPRILPVGEEEKPDLLATLLSCDVGQRAYEDPDAGHGVFTTYLLKGLAGEAAAQNGPVELRRLAEYVTREVSDWAKRNNKQQTPRLVAEGDGDLVLLTPPPEPLVSVSFQRQPLSAVVELIATQYGAQVVLGKGVDPTATVSGHLENQPLSTVLKVLLLAVDLQMRREGPIYIIEGQRVATGQPPAGMLPTGFEGPVLTVAQDGSGQYSSVAEAISQAPAGAILKIKPGEYPGSILVRQRLALLADGRPGEVVLSQTGDGQFCQFDAGAAGTLVRGLTLVFRGQAVADAGTIAAVLVYTSLEFEDCRFVNQLPISPSSGVMVLPQPGQPVSVAFRHCATEGFTLSSLSIAGQSATVEVDDCRLVNRIYATGGPEVHVRRTILTAIGQQADLFHVDAATLEASDCILIGVSGPPLIHAGGGARVQLDRCRFNAPREHVTEKIILGTVELNECEFSVDPAMLTIPGLPE